MKKTKKIISILMIASITIVSFSGCGTSISTSTNVSTSASANATKSDSNKNDSTKMKTLYSNVLKSMVKDNTITQIQSDKVLDVVIKDPTADGTPPKGGNKPTGTKGDTKPTGKAPGKDGTKPTGTAHENDKLSELVTSKVISQTQSDTINQKFQEAMKSDSGTSTK